MADVSAAALLPYGITPAGVIAAVPPKGNPFLAGIDMSQVKSLAEVFGEINMEGLAALDPDLIVTSNFGDYVGYTKSKAQQKQLEAIAPIVTIRGDGPTGRMLDRYGELAKDLGGDLTDPALVAGQQHYQQAVEDLKTAAAAKPDLKVLVVRGTADGFYVLNPKAGYDIGDYAAWGVNIVSPTGGDKYGEVLSWEEVNKYPAT